MSSPGRATQAITAMGRRVRRLVAALGAWRDNARARHWLLRCQDIDPRFAADIGLTINGLTAEARRRCWRRPRRQ